MISEALELDWVEADVDVADLWTRSGGQWLTAPGVAVPDRAVRGIAGLGRCLDERGAGLSRVLGAAGVGVIGERAAALGLPPSGVVSCGGSSRLLRSRDGWVAVTLARPDDIESIPAWLDAEPRGVGDRWPRLERAIRRRSSGALVDRARLLGLACAAVGETSDKPPVVGTRLGEAVGRPLSGLVVVNLASLWAGPLAADVLARLGARVITVESLNRSDGSRATPGFFASLHGRSESAALRLDRNEGRAQLAELLGRVDVVIEGSRPRALAQMGIDARSVVEHGPRLWVSITAHGRDTPSGQRVGYGDDASAAGGLVGWVEGAPRFLADALADPITGLVAAATVVQLVEGGGRWLVDVALARVAASMRTRDDDPVVEPTGDACPPRRRTDPGKALPLGRDTSAVLTEFGIEP